MRQTHSIGILMVCVSLVGCTESQTPIRPSGRAFAAPAASRSDQVTKPASGSPKVASRTDAPRTPLASGGGVLLPHCLVSLIYEAQVPAEEAGVLLEVLVQEGTQVSTHGLLAKIDDTHARMQLDVAAYKLAVAKETAENDIHVQYSKAAAAVAKAELDQAVEANRLHPGTVTRAEVWRLQLTWKRATLEIDQAIINQRIAQKELQVSEAELAAATENLDRRLIKAPMMSAPLVDENGKAVVDESGNPVCRDNVKAEVVELSRHAGEWVLAGDPVLHLVRMDRLRIEGFLNRSKISPGDVINQPVTVSVPLAGGRVEQFLGKVVFVNTLVQAGGEYQVWAEVDNRKEQRSGLWLLRPGLQVEMTIELKK